MRCRRQQSGRSDRVGNRRHIGDRADLQIAARGQLQRSGSEAIRRVGQGR